MTLGLLAYRNLLRRPTRTLLLVFGIALAVATALALLALSRGIERSTADSARERGADLSVLQRDASDIFSGFVDAKLEPAIAAIPGVKGVAGELVMFAPVDGEYQFLAVGMADDSYFWPAMPIAEGPASEQGRAPCRADRRERRQGAGQAHRRGAHHLRPDGEDHRRDRLPGGGQPRRHRAQAGGPAGDVVSRRPGHRLPYHARARHRQRRHRGGQEEDRGARAGQRRPDRPAAGGGPQPPGAEGGIAGDLADRAGHRGPERPQRAPDGGAGADARDRHPDGDRLERPAHHGGDRARRR